MTKSNTCLVCGSPVHPLANYCKRCKKLINRGDIRRKINKKAREKALKQAWDGKGFCCYYTGIILDENVPKSPIYITFDHRIPKKEDDIVVTAQVINDMKSDLSEDEFKQVIIELAKRFNGGIFNPEVLKNLKYWKR